MLLTRTTLYALTSVALIAPSACRRHDAPHSAGVPASTTARVDSNFDYAANIGLVELKDSSRACLAIKRGLSVGDSLTLVSVPATGDEGQSALLTTYVASTEAASCATDSTGVGVAQGGDVLYTLTRASPPLEPLKIYFAIASPRSHFLFEGGAVRAQLRANDEPASFRICASTEGLHFTVWSGAPLTGKRVWHRYYYLGYDVEPSCDEADWNGTE